MSISAEKRIQQHIEALNSPDVKVAVRAEGYLIRYYSSRALEPLIAACDHPNPAVRYRAAWALAYTYDSGAFETLLRLTRDPVGAVRYDAAIALGILGDERAVEPLILLLTMTDPDEVADGAAMGLERLGKPAIPALIALLKSPSMSQPGTVANVLGGIGDEVAIEPIAQLLSHGDAIIRGEAIEALWSIGTHRCLALIEGCREDTSEHVRGVADYCYQDLAHRLSTQENGVGAQGIQLFQ